MTDVPIEPEAEGVDAEAGQPLDIAAPPPEDRLAESVAPAEADVVTRLREALAASEERTLRAVADFDNFRRRTAAANEEAAREQKKALLLDLLEVQDNFTRALEHWTGDDNEFVAGIRAIRQQLEGLLIRHQVERVAALGQPFDPRVHDVLDARPDPAVSVDTVDRVYKEGYLFCGKLLRPALVGVAQATRAAGTPAGEEEDLGSE
ncbi:MAG TPA: nucleotide exchange factor GrpE [Acidobacteriota bacterium]|nr:nucleotide exchange factor GrpE [Acidobacteriota bacterium]HOS99422.1 nucleotide exchange factor GrpE [Acidobacteriota bacterium]HQF87314.1 nucleotide exchange factor GrpE [Acidobacteriota bacterium]HQG91888.1 nucleotide exchange factor GrpE [Acidobacteriota bacterium]